MRNPQIVTDGCARCRSPVRAVAALAIGLLGTLAAASPDTRAGGASPGAGEQPPGDTPDTVAAIGQLTTTPDNDYTRRTSGAGFEALDDAAFGEQTDARTGALTFLQSDANASGIGPDIVIRRSFNPAKQGSVRWPHFGAFADWDLEIPRISTETYNGDEIRPADASASAATAPRGPWLGSAGGAAARCSSFGAPPAPSAPNTIPLESHYWWRGVQLLIPGEGARELLQRGPSNGLAPTSSFGLPGNPSFPIVTTDHWMIGCLPSTANGEPGQAFFAVSPNGTKYWFNWLVYEFIPSMNLPEPVSDASPLLRVRASMLVTRIEDSHGNALTFEYTGRNLTRITASDGRDLVIGYRTDVSSSEPLFPLSLVDSVTLQPAAGQPRTWRYAYDGIAPGGVMNQVSMRRLVLRGITLPDYSAWSFALGALDNICGLALPDYRFGAGATEGCLGDGQTDNRTFAGSMTGPSGLTGTFTVTKLLHARNGGPTPFLVRLYNPFASLAASLVSKRYTGPGVDRLWQYRYAPSAPQIIGRDVNCAIYPGLCGVSTARVTTVAPDSTVSVASFANDWGAPLGDLTRLDEGAVLDGGGGVVSAARTTTWSHTAPATGPYPAIVGTAPASYVNHDRLQTLRPIKQRTISQDGATFTWQAGSFDGYARAVQSTSSSSLGFSRTETTAYADRTDPWVIGLVDTVSTGGIPGAVVDNDYSPLGDVVKVARFGKTEREMTYHADGTLASRTDGAGPSHRIFFGNYKFGVPRRIDYPGGAFATSVVDDFGQITSVTDASSSTTGYEYDRLGRLSRTTWPAGDTTAWNPTSVIHEIVPAAEVGLAAGHWRKTTTTGNAVEVIYYDALWRPVLSKAYDASDEANTRRMVLTRYDAGGRVGFVSYPQRLIGSVADAPPGTSSTYDALDRPYQSVASSELGPLTTTTEFLPGFRKRVTNARAHATTISFQAFDEPAESAPVAIEEPENTTTTISRNALGKPLSITRGGAWAGGHVGATRRYVYDANQRVCKAIDPESLATVIDYDAAGNVAWQASGQALGSLTSCDRPSVPPAQKTTFGYDNRNRPTGIAFGDNSPGITLTYTPDGLTASITSDDSRWDYRYNKRRLLEKETLTLGGAAYPSSYTYTPNGHPGTFTYPDGNALDYAPNALGEARQVGTYASAIRRHPNGALAGFRYGNGVQHTTSQNLRGLPSRSQDGSILDDAYTYDANANVVAIADQAQGGFYSRTMGYDGRNRLTSASNTAVWAGPVSFAYDPLDNLRRSTTSAGLDLTHDYNADTNRLDLIKNTSNGAPILSYTYDERGRVRARNAQTFTVDLADRVTQVGPNVATYRYDGLGRRTSKTKGGATTVQVYSHDGRLVYQAAPNTTDGIFRSGFQAGDVPYPANQGGQKRFVYLGRHLIAEDGSAGRSYTYTDGLGTPVGKTTATGVDRYFYMPFGWIVGGTAVDGPGFTGHVTDTETSLSYMQQRYYDPFAARFLSGDPAPVSFANGGNFNRYAYANNSPYKFVDPDGRACVGSSAPITDCSHDSPARLIGNPQRTGGATHASTSLRIALQYLDDPAVAEVHMNRHLRYVLKDPMAPRIKPDVTVVYKDASMLDMIEVVSPSQSKKYLEKKLHVARHQMTYTGADHVVLPDAPTPGGGLRPPPAGAFRALGAFSVLQIAIEAWLNEVDRRRWDAMSWEEKCQQIDCV